MRAFAALLLELYTSHVVSLGFRFRFLCGDPARGGIIENLGCVCVEECMVGSLETW